MKDQSDSNTTNQTGSINIGTKNSVEVGGDMVGGNKIEATFGDVGAEAQVAVGTNITLTKTTQPASQTLTDAERVEILRLMTDLKTQIASLNIPEDKQHAGQVFAKELETELTKTDVKPDSSVIKVAGNWLLKNIPALAGAIAGLFLNPIIGKVVGAAGDIAADWVKEKFGEGS